MRIHFAAQRVARLPAEADRQPPLLGLVCSLCLPALFCIDQHPLDTTPLCKNTFEIMCSHSKHILILSILMAICSIPENKFCFAQKAKPLTIDCDYPGGNIVLERIEGDAVFVHQDLRDTKGNWFYWNFRVRGAAGRQLKFYFTKSRAIGVSGPACSVDQGRTWKWLGKTAVNKNSFTFDFHEHNDVRFCFAIPYQQKDLERFLQKYESSPLLRREQLCQTKKGRDVWRLHLGNPDQQPDHRVIITARHHACEMIASYTVEGLMAAVLSDNETGQYFQNHVDLLVIPIVDLDGVEDGDQGKNRKPRDHNRDYIDKSVHPEVQAIRNFIPKWSLGKLHFGLDVHNPYISGNYNEQIYLVEKGGKFAETAREFGLILQKVRSGPLPYRADDNLPFGTGWNTANNYKQGMPFGKWISLQPGIKFAATIEIPYANVRGITVTAESARAFGHDLAQAIRLYLHKIETDSK